MEKDLKTSIPMEKTPKLTSLVIETATNGFILFPNGMPDPRDMCNARPTKDRLVFNTREQLKEYIDNNF